MNWLNQILETRASIRLAHEFDKTPTPAIIGFEACVLVFALVSILVLARSDRHIVRKFLVVALGIFIFEFFTSPMWNNYKMGAWAYVYQDVSWVLTVGWTSLILCAIAFVDRVFSGRQEWKRFLLYLAVLSGIVPILEWVVVQLGIRSYSPEVLESGGRLCWGVPLGVLYYVPVFMALVISFYRYVSFMLLDTPVIPVKHRKWFRSLLISFLAVFLFELMIEPMVVNAKLPRWSYVYRDINVLLTGGWIVIVWLATNIVDKLWIHIDLLGKFLRYLFVIFIVALPIESWLIVNGYRIYGPSTVSAFSGFVVPVAQVPVEIAFAIPFYFALVVSFIKYWEIILDNERI